MKLRFAMLGVIGVFAALFAFLVWRDAEPVLRGQPLSYWIEPWRSKAETPEAIAAAYAEMDERHVRWLVRELDWKPSPLRKPIARLVNSMGDMMSSQSPGDRRESAATALGRLGERATPAVPVLRRTTTTTVEPRVWQARCAAYAALIRLGEEPAEPWLEVLRDPRHTNWLYAADVVARLGTNAPGAAELYEAAMNSSLPAGVRIRAMMLYRFAQPNSARTAQVVTQAMSSPAFHSMGLYTLETLGTNAALAAPAVTALLLDTNAAIRRHATNTLRAIAPALARESGIQ